MMTSKNLLNGLEKNQLNFTKKQNLAMNENLKDEDRIANMILKIDKFLKSPAGKLQAI